MKNIQTIVLVTVLMILFGCQSFGQTVKVGEPFTLKSNEAAKIKDTNIEITVNRIGRKWLANGGEYLDFTFSVKQGEKTESYSNPVPPVITAGGYKIEVVKTEPFGDGYAVFIVSKNDSVKSDSIKKNDDSIDAVAAKFVEQFGWHLDESIAPVKVPLEFPNNFEGLPFYNYQAASTTSGVDLTPLLGKKVDMLKYTLKEKQSDRGTDYTSFAHLIIENGKVVGAWRTDSSDRTPGIYSFGKKKVI